MAKRHEVLLAGVRDLLHEPKTTNAGRKTAALICSPSDWKDVLTGNAVVVIDISLLVASDSSWRSEVFDSSSTSLTIAYVASRATGSSISPSVGTSARHTTGTNASHKMGLSRSVHIPEEWLRPQTTAELREIFHDNQFEGLVFDVSLPVDLSVDWVTELLPREVVAHAPRPCNILTGLLAWGASIPSIRYINALLPRSITTSSAAEWLRSYVGSRLGLISVLELPDDIFKPKITSAATTIVYFGEGRALSHFERVASTVEFTDMTSRPWHAGVTSWLRGDTPTTGFLRERSEVTKWAVVPNSPALQTTQQRLARLGRSTRLGDVCDVFMGVRRGLIHEAPDGYPVIMSSDIIEGTLVLESIKRHEISAAMPEKQWLRPGDIMLPKRGGAVAVMYTSDEKAVASDTVAVVRPHDGVLNSAYLCEFLNSPTGQLLVRESVESGFVAPSRLRRIHVPLLDSSFSSGLHEITAVVNQIQDLAQHLRDRSRALFESESEGALREQLGDLKRIGKVLTTAMLSMDRLDYQISSLYPFPIAFGYRLLASKAQPHELLSEQLRLTEAVLAFIGSISLALVWQRGEADVGLDLNDVWQGGVSPGTWRDIIARSSKVLKSHKENALSSCIAALDIGSSKKGFGRAIERLIVLRNNYFHGRGPHTPEEIVSASQEAGSNIGECMRQLAFLTEFPIRLVSNIDVSRRDEIALSCIRYMGDHPGLTQEDIPFSRALHKGDLYVEVGPNNWLPLFPFLSVNSCPACKVREVFFIDSWAEARTIARLKSFDRGHTFDSDDVAAELTRVISRLNPPAHACMVD